MRLFLSVPGPDASTPTPRARPPAGHHSRRRDGGTALISGRYPRPLHARRARHDRRTATDPPRCAEPVASMLLDGPCGVRRYPPTEGRSTRQSGGSVPVWLLHSERSMTAVVSLLRQPHGFEGCGGIAVTGDAPDPPRLSSKTKPAIESIATPLWPRALTRPITATRFPRSWNSRGSIRKPSQSSSMSSTNCRTPWCPRYTMPSSWARNGTHWQSSAESRSSPSTSRALKAS